MTSIDAHIAAIEAPTGDQEADHAAADRAIVAAVQAIASDLRTGWLTPKAAADKLTELASAYEDQMQNGGWWYA